MRLTVGRNGEDYYTINEAIEAVPYNEKAEIVISSGVYNERIFSDKKDLKIIGDGDVTIRFALFAKEIMPDGIKRGTFRTATAFFSGERLELENIAIENTAGLGKDVGQALALYLDVDYAELKNVKLKAHQDTLFLAPLPEKEREKRGFYGPRVFSKRKLNKVIIDSSYIEGGVDFIFGGADALIMNSEIVSNEIGYVSAPSGYKKDIGFVFYNCSFNNKDIEDGSCFLMRPWREEGKSTFIDCTYGSHINSAGFSPWHGLEGDIDKATFLVDSPAFGSKYEISKEECKKILKEFNVSI